LRRWWMGGRYLLHISTYLLLNPSALSEAKECILALEGS
jgi:hypothetical protein